MDSIDILMSEHRLIEKVLDALENYITKMQFGVPVNGDDLRQFVTFVREFADHCHHGKEEDILFEAMVKNGFPREQGPIAVMLSEHTEGRRLVGVLNGVAAHPEPWSREDRRMISEAALGYIQLLRRHIKKEDNILYPAARAKLSPDIQKGIEEQFEQFEREEIGAGEHEKLYTLADSLALKYGGSQDSQKHSH
jgi:hemerythrin-like domain-containing protein